MKDQEDSKGSDEYINGGGRIAQHKVRRGSGGFVIVM